jgi:predicted transcriptional regulator
MNILLLSLHHGQNILSEKKTIELRKKPLRENDGKLAFSRVLIYEKKTKAIIGYCEPVSTTIWGDAQIFCSYSKQLCLSHDEIYEYLGDNWGYGIVLRNPQVIAPIPLVTMREAGINPPQCYRYLNDFSLDLVVSGKLSVSQSRQQNQL